jgi:hypothetical protein
VGDHDRGVHVQHHHPLADVPTGRPGPRWVTEEFPQPHPDLRPRRRDAPQPHPVDLVQRPPYRGVRGHLREHLVLVAQHVDIRDRLTTISDQHGEIDQHPAAVMHRQRPRPSQRAGHTASVRPARSAGIRNSAAPTCDTTPVPSAVTRRSFDHAVDRTSEVPPW